MAGSTTEQPLPLAALYVVSHTHWDREWYESFETFRARLLDVVANLLESMDVHDKPVTYFLLDGQTVLLEDIAQIRPDIVPLLVIYNASGRLQIGPWYVQVDEALVSGEALIRNLLAARADALRYGISLMPIGYVPDTFGHTAQLPQILRGFGIDTALLYRGGPVPRMPFRWAAPDGSSVLVINHFYFQPRSDDQDYNSIQESWQAQQTTEPDGPWLWMNGRDHQPVTPHLADILSHLSERFGIPVGQASLPSYVKALRRSLPDELRPALMGELRLHTLTSDDYLLPGTLSARQYLKQANTQAQNLLTYAAEPWTTIALTHGHVDHPQNIRAQLHYTWRTLLKNQAHDSICGCSTDVVHTENETRFVQVLDSAEHIVREALTALPGVPAPKRRWPAVLDDQSTCIVIWNPHNAPVRQVVEVSVVLPPDRHPHTLLNPDGGEELFGWAVSTSDEDVMLGQQRGVLSFIADAMPVGYTSYILNLASEPTAEDDLVTVINGSVISSRTGDTLDIDDGQLVWTHGDMQMGDLLRFFDGGDAGDTYNYSPPQPDIITPAEIIGDIRIESTNIYQRLHFQHRIRVAPELRPNRSRERGLKSLILNTSATLYEGMPGIYFRTTFDNNVKDHRLRVHLRTGLASDTTLSDTAFALVRRPVKIPGPELFPPNTHQESIANTHPMHSLCAVEDDSLAFALLGRGLTEYQGIHEDGQTTLAMTLVRSVGWLSRGDLVTRTSHAGPALAVPDAQCQRLLTVDYAAGYFPDSSPTGLLRAGLQYQSPLQAFQYTQPPEVRRQSYFSVEGDSVVLTALKPPQNGNGWIAHILNPGDDPAEAHLAAVTRPRGMQRVTLAEENISAIPLENGVASIVLKPGELAAIRVQFDG